MTNLRLIVFAIALALLLAAPVGAATIETESALAKLGFPADTKTKVLAGQFVETALTTASDRDLNVGIAFLVKKSPERLTRELFDGILLQRIDPATIAHGTIEGDGTPEQLAGLQLTPGQQKAYASAAPGSALNLSPAEIAALNDAGKDPAAVASAVRNLLLLRYRAYRTNGVDGIAAYARANGRSRPDSDLVAVNQAARTDAILPPEFYDLLEGFPKNVPPHLTQVFHWSQFKAHDADTIALTHAFTGTFGGALVAVQRQYYVSTGYNAEQAIAGFIPVAEGTLVVYTNHTSTDQVAGVGGGAKRSIGRKFMASELEDLFKKIGAAGH